MKPIPLSLFDIVCGFTKLEFSPLTTDECALCDEAEVARFNADHADATMYLTGPVQPDGVWLGDGARPPFQPGVYDPVWKRWRKLGLEPLPIIGGRRIKLHLHHKSAKNAKGELIPSRQGPIVSRPFSEDETGWALDPATFSKCGFVFCGVLVRERERGGIPVMSARAFKALANRHWETTLRQRVSRHELQDAVVKLRGRKPTYLETFGKQEHAHCDISKCGWAAAHKKWGSFKSSVDQAA